MADLIPKQERQRPIFGQIFFLIVAVLVFGGLLALFFVLQYLQGEADATLEQLERVVREDTRPQERGLQQELEGYDVQLAALQAVLDERKSMLTFFGMLERSTHADITFMALSGEQFQEGVVELQGEAASFFALEQQRLVWKDWEGVERATIQEIGLAPEGGVEFQVEFLLSSQFLEPSPGSLDIESVSPAETEPEPAESITSEAASEDL